MANFRFDPCPICCAHRCCGDDGPEQIQLEISGITNNTCQQCESLNGTYILEREPLFPGTPQEFYCYWRYFFPSPICDSGGGGGDYIDAFVWDSGNPPNQTHQMWIAFEQARGVWHTDYFAEPCKQLPPQTLYGTWGDGACHLGHNAVCKVTMLS